jgi:hypothetical protein
VDEAIQQRLKSQRARLAGMMPDRGLGGGLAMRALTIVAAMLMCGTVRAGEDAAELASRVQSWVASLDDAQRAKAVMPFDSPERTNWTYLPQVRAGLPIKEQSAHQRELASAMLQSALSAAGYDTVERVRSLEAVLRDDMGESGGVRDPDKYYVAVFGAPSKDDAWGLRLEGHHISLNFTIRDGAIIASTPQFFGANPQEVRVGPTKGFRAIGEYEDLAREFLAGLDEEQRARAIGPGKAPADILTRFDPVAMPPDATQGIAYSELSQEQQAKLTKIIETAAGVQRPGVATARLQKLREAGLEKIRFVWLGGTEPGQPHYYRVQGPTFVFEYDNTQNGANHSHTVWRDFAGDFGRDVLRDHFEAYHRRPIAGVVAGAI